LIEPGGGGGLRLSFQTRGAALDAEAIMMLFLFEVIRTKPSGRTEFLGAFLVVRVNVFHTRTIRLSIYCVGLRNGEGERDCGNSKELSESLSKKETRTCLRTDMMIWSGEVKW